MKIFGVNDCSVEPMDIIIFQTFLPEDALLGLYWCHLQLLLVYHPAFSARKAKHALLSWDQVIDCLLNTASFLFLLQLLGYSCRMLGTKFVSLLLNSSEPPPLAATHAHACYDIGPGNSLKIWWNRNMPFSRCTLSERKWSKAVENNILVRLPVTKINEWSEY